jgi:molybdate transport system regulatory protein
MARLWVVCGAGRGVGKTHVAHALGLVLPDAVVGKQGHHAAQVGRPGNLLHTDEEVEAFLMAHAGHAHVVLESNAAARAGRGDVTIFVEGSPAGMDRRPDADALRAAAGIVLAPEIPLHCWRAALEPVVPEPDLRGAVLDALLGSLRWRSDPPLRARAKVWIEPPQGPGFGQGLVDLLALVGETGTLRAAAQGAGMSYRHAWDLVRAAEEQLGVPLVAAQPGGPRGGSSSLTALGCRMLGVHRQLDADVAEFAAKRLEELLPA